MRIIHIEDSECQARIVSTLFQHSIEPTDYTYTWFSSLSSASYAVINNQADVILLDLSLPDSSGIESVQIVRSWNTAAPIIVLTGTNDINVAKAAIHAGASIYILKRDISALPLITILTVERWRIEKELKDRCSLYDSVVNNSPDYVVRFFSDGIITFANTSFSNLVGISVDKLIGTSICSYLSEETQIRFKRLGQSLETICLIEDKEEVQINNRWISWRATTTKTATGKIIEIQCVGRDITNEKEKENRFIDVTRTQMENSRVAIAQQMDMTFELIAELDKSLTAIEDRRC